MYLSKLVYSEEVVFFHIVRQQQVLCTLQIRNLVHGAALLQFSISAPPQTCLDCPVFFFFQLFARRQGDARDVPSSFACLLKLSESHNSAMQIGPSGRRVSPTWWRLVECVLK